MLTSTSRYVKSPPNPPNSTVIWETVPNPDPHALLKAVAMLFHRRVPLSTGADLTKHGRRAIV